MYIYKTTNTVSGKIYIGLSTKKPSNSTNYIGSGVILRKAILRYGKESFTKEILEEHDSIELLRQREIYWIDFYDSRNPNVGYNVAEGGLGGDTISSHPNREDIISNASIKSKLVWEDKSYRDKMSNIRKENWKDESYRDKMHEARLGRIIGDYQKQRIRETWTGKKHKESTIEKIRENATGRKYTEEVNKSKGRPGKKWWKNTETNQTIQTYEELSYPWVRGRGKLK